MIIELRNFQRHKYMRVEIDDITTIIGPSDSGKSSILRALAWIATNRPSGLAFIRHGATKTKVSLTIDENVIERIRSKKTNKYVVNGKPLVSFGSDVPEEVKNILQFSDVAFQSQHDAPFWISASGGQVSKEINRVIDLSVIDDSLNKAASAHREAASRSAVIQERVESLEAQAKAMEWVPLLAGDFKRLESFAEALERAETKIRGLSTAIESIGKGLTSLRIAEKRFQGVLLALGRLKAANREIERARALDGIIRRIESLESLPPIPAIDVSEMIRVTKQIDQLEAVISKIERNQETWNEVKRKISHAKKTKTICPTCGQTISKQS